MLINGKRLQRGGEQSQTLSQTLRGSHGLVDRCDPFVHKQGLDHLREQIFLALGEMVIQSRGHHLYRVGDLFHGNAFVALRKKESLRGGENLLPGGLVEGGSWANSFVFDWLRHAVSSLRNFQNI